MRPALLILIATLALAWMLPVSDARAASAEEKVVAALVDYARAAAEAGQVDEGRRALAEAERLGPSDDADAVRSALDEAADESSEEATAALRRKRGPAIAKLYGKLTDDDHRGLLGALSWDAPKWAKKVVSAVKKASKDPVAAGWLLTRARRIDRAGDADGVYDAAERALVSDDLALIGAGDQRLVAFVSLPGGWKKGKSYPVLVAVDGSGSNFKGCGAKFAETRGGREVIVVSPVTFSNTNALQPEKYPWYDADTVSEHDGDHTARMAFDMAGVNALLAELATRYGAEERVFLTGFSGGGQFTYNKLLQEPATVRGAAPACANFGGRGIEGAPGVTDGGPPVHILTGAEDPHRDHVFGNPPGIEGQSDLAEKALAELGYTNVRRTMLPGVKHSALHGQVWKFVDEVLEGR